MPDWKVHLIFGFLLLPFWISLNQFFHISDLEFQKMLALVLIVSLVSIFPDVDMKKSKSREVFAIFLSTLITLIYFVLYQETWYYGIAYFFLSYFLITLLPTKHRGITHSLAFSLIFSVLVTFVFSLILFDVKDYPFFFLIIFSTYSLHLLLDNF